jgi:hypothetical protein
MPRSERQIEGSLGKSQSQPTRREFRLALVKRERAVPHCLRGAVAPAVPNRGNG